MLAYIAAGATTAIVSKVLCMYMHMRPLSTINLLVLGPNPCPLPSSQEVPTYGGGGWNRLYYPTAARNRVCKGESKEIQRNYVQRDKPRRGGRVDAIYYLHIPHTPQVCISPARPVSWVRL